MTPEIPDFGLAGLRWDLRDKLGGFCVVCGVEWDGDLCDACSASPVSQRVSGGGVG